MLHPTATAKGGDVRFTYTYTIITLAALAGSCSAAVARGPLTDPAPKPTAAEVRLVARVVWAEARADGAAGMQAVASVVRNRVRHGNDNLFGKTYSQVVRRKFAFSCLNAGDPNRAKMFAVERLPPDVADAKLWAVAQRVTRQVLSGTLPDNTGGATFFHARATTPKWKSATRTLATIGGHVFARLRVSA